MDGRRTDFPTCNFVVGVSVMLRGGLEPELKINPRCLVDGKFKITAAKWGISSSAPLIMCDDARLLWSMYSVQSVSTFFLHTEPASSAKCFFDKRSRYTVTRVRF